MLGLAVGDNVEVVVAGTAVLAAVAVYIVQVQVLAVDFLRLEPGAPGQR